MFKLWVKSLKWLPQRISRSGLALLRLFYSKPQYTLLAAIVSILFYELIFWFLNLGLAHYLLTTPFLTFTDKAELIIGSFSGIFAKPYSELAIMLFAVSVLQGIAVASMVYSIRAARAMNKNIMKDLGGTGIAGAFSILGLGCAACGSSLVTPILTFFFASSSVALAETVGIYSAILALFVALITVYLSGLKLSTKLS